MFHRIAIYGILLVIAICCIYLDEEELLIFAICGFCIGYLIAAIENQCKKYTSKIDKYTTEYEKQNRYISMMK